MRSNGRCATQIRRLTAADMKKVLTLVSQISPATDLVESARSQFQLELDQPHPDAIRLVAVVDHVVVGTLGCGAGPFPSRRVLWMDWLVVDRDYRRCGIASLLYEEIETHAVGLRKNHLCLDLGNIDKERAAYEFHHGNGFQVVGIIPDYWSEYEHLNIMVKRLNFLG